MDNDNKLNLICGGFPRCGTTAFAKYFDKYTNVKVLKEPNTGFYEYNALNGEEICKHYNSEIHSGDHVFHKFSGYTKTHSLPLAMSRIGTDRNNTILLLMLGNQYERLRSWHAFQKSKAIESIDKTDFGDEKHKFHSECSLREYYNDIGHKRIDYLTALQKITKSNEGFRILVVCQADLHRQPTEVFGILANELGFSLYPITRQLNIKPTRLQPGIIRASDPELAKELSEQYGETLKWAKEKNLLVEINKLRTRVNKTKIKPPGKVTNESDKQDMPILRNPRLSSNVLVIGNGQSAGLVNFDRIKKLGITTCGMNSAYRHWERIDYRPTYYVCMDTVVIKSQAQAISRLIDEDRIQYFFLRNEFLNCCPQYQNHPRIIWFDEIRALNEPLFATSLVTTGSWSIRWMLSLGYKLIATIGVDANYIEIINEAVRSSKLELEIKSTPQYNPNYYFDDYQQAGDAYNIPNDPQYVKEYGTTVHADALTNVREDMERLALPNRVFDLSPLSRHGAFPKLSISDYLDSQRVSLTTAICLGAGIVDGATANADALLHNLSQARVSVVNCLLEGDFTWWYENLDNKRKLDIDAHLSSGRLNLIPTSKRPNYRELFCRAKKSIPSIAIVSDWHLMYSNDLLEAICTSHSLHPPLSISSLSIWKTAQEDEYLEERVDVSERQELHGDHTNQPSIANRTSFDYYVFNKSLFIPDSLSRVIVNTNRCETAIAAIYRAYGAVVETKCLFPEAANADNENKGNSAEDDALQIMRNVDAFKSALTEEVKNTFGDDTVMTTLDHLDTGSISIGPSNHSLGRWYSVLRMFGAAQCSQSYARKSSIFQEFNISAEKLLTCEAELCTRLEDAFRQGCFLEIIVGDGNGTSDLECFGQSKKLQEMKDKLDNYDRKYILVTRKVDKISRRAFDRFMLFFKNQLLAEHKYLSVNDCNCVASE